MDVFCEEGFSLPRNQSHNAEGQEQGFKLKIHADEIIPLQGLSLQENGRRFRRAFVGCVGGRNNCNGRSGSYGGAASGNFLLSNVVRPGTENDGQGVRVHWQPTTTLDLPTENLQSIMTFACFGMKMTPEEIIKE